MGRGDYDGRQWGNWRYRHAALALDLWKNDKAVYEVDLEECNDSAEILDWILQVSEKIDTTPDDIGHLVLALDDLGDCLQGKVCPGGQDKKFDFGAFLRS